MSTETTEAGHEPECDICEDAHEVTGWPDGIIPCPFCTLVMLPEADDER